MQKESFEQRSREARQVKTEKPLPNSLPGAVCRQYVVRDGKRFGPYFYRFYRESGRLKKRYVRPADIEATTAACATNRADKRQSAESNARRRQKHKELTGILRLMRLLDAFDRKRDPSENDLQKLERAAELAGLI